jgi:hypothetical protein
MIEVTYLAGRPFCAAPDYARLMGLTATALLKRAYAHPDLWKTRKLGASRFLDLYAAYAAEGPPGKLMLATTFPEIDFANGGE